MSWERVVEDALGSSLHAAAEHAAASAREHARAMGWPEDASSKLAATAHGGRLSVDYLGAEDWEEGTPDRPPLPAARRAESKVHETDQVFASAIAHALRDHI